MNVTDHDRIVSTARRAARTEVAFLLGRQTASGNLAADRIADAVLLALSPRDPNAWPTRAEMRDLLERIRHSHATESETPDAT